VAAALKHFGHRAFHLELQVATEAKLIHGAAVPVLWRYLKLQVKCAMAKVLERRSHNIALIKDFAAGGQQCPFDQ